MLKVSASGSVEQEAPSVAFIGYLLATHRSTHFCIYTYFAHASYTEDLDDDEVVDGHLCWPLIVICCTTHAGNIIVVIVIICTVIERICTQLRHSV